MPFTIAPVWSFDAPCSGSDEYRSTVAPPPPPLLVLVPAPVLPVLPPLSLLSSLPHAAVPNASAPTQPTSAKVRSLTYSLQSGKADVRRHPTLPEGRTAIDNR